MEGYFYTIFFNQMFNCSISAEVSESLLYALHSANSIFLSKWEKSKSFPCLPRKTFVIDASVASNWLAFVIRSKFISFSNKVFITAVPFAIVWSCLLHNISTGFFCTAESESKLYKNLKVKDYFHYRMWCTICVYLLCYITDIFLESHWINYINKSFCG